MLTPIILLVILGIDWASGYAIAGYVMRHGVAPNGYAFWQSIGPLLCLFLIQVLRRDLRFIKGGLRYAVGCGIFGIVIPNLIIYYSAKNIDSGILTILANVTPLFAYLLALLFHQEKFNKSRLMLVLLGVVGILIIVIPLKINIISGLHSIWLYISLLIPLSYAFSFVFVSRYKPLAGNVLNYSFWMLLVSSMIITPLTLSTHDFYPLALNDFNACLILLEIILSSFGYVLLFIIIHKVGPVFFTLVNAVAAVSGVFYARLIFNQSISNSIYVAIVLIVIAILGLGVKPKLIIFSKNKWV